MDRKQDIQELVEGFKTIQRHLTSLVREASDESITQVQWQVILFVAGNKRSNVRDLHKALRITSSAATQLVNTLEEKGLVFRRQHPEDGRVSLLVLSQKAEVAVRKMKQRRIRKLNSLLSKLTDEEISTYLGLHRKLIERI
ncbi:MAG: MarR family transcriptional regulator [Candidatus Moranbacteria bacterium]|nr:MarR family transcriptional regulator [Candidatus Moranbacteria bacterium]